MSKSRKSQSPAAFADVKHVMDMALKKPGLMFCCETTGRAVHFKQRCNRFRNLVREIEQERLFGVPGARAETAYDILVIRQTDRMGNSSRDGKCVVFDHEATKGTLIDPETGEEIKLESGIPSIVGDEDE